MARFAATSKLFSAFVAEGIAPIRFGVGMCRRGYSTATQGLVSNAASLRSGMMMNKKGEENNKTTSPWVPDPVTGYYRPENHTDEIDVADLRDMLLKQPKISKK
ncbi:Late embryogenesis abundant protein, LEA_3 subgroup [Dillenia turbinata]|uniref:Late embryogenesis abundant protein, LEA_3 subgroup n=1 Tax=Dillenia turbinata TaxID=194707 RepID=A0AAN8ZH02_9MAGN